MEEINLSESDYLFVLGADGGGWQILETAVFQDTERLCFRPIEYALMFRHKANTLAYVVALNQALAKGKPI